MEHSLAMLPFFYSDDYGDDIITIDHNPGGHRVIRDSDMAMFHAHPRYYYRFLYSEILEATGRGERSLRDLPVEIIAEILSTVASSSRNTGLALAQASPWIANATHAARLAHVTLRTSRHVFSFHSLVCSSAGAASAVRTLWIGNSIGRTAEMMIPAILAVCPNIRALACHLAPLEILCRSKEPFPPWLLSVQLELTEFMGMPWQSPVSKWTRLARTTHGTAFLHNITHLRLPSHHYLFREFFPAQYLPHLTHLAMGSERCWSRSPEEYATYLRDFSRSLEHVWIVTSLQLAVLVFRAYSRHSYHPWPPEMWQTRELVLAARACGPNILAYRAPDRHFRESMFWDECVAEGDDIWSLAQKQMTFDSVTED
ncbi:hypothetical protein B0H17DRAFT_1177270 [Mycena rosella]|uniref:Uncharacterized protein n=1 Tax=Mycena rosella TaxID=1033263 RepID=A0AAD7DTC2_MYCRO|nr:hypothetical protein B0H17DRAFT_1177270 [Mycena rosella]